MGHPMDSWLDEQADTRTRRWARRDAVEECLKPIPLSEFTFAQFADLQLLADRSAVSDRWDQLEKALGRLEKFVLARDNGRKKRKQ